MDDVRGINIVDAHYVCDYCAKDIDKAVDVSMSATGSAVERDSPMACEECGDLLGDIEMTDEGYRYIARAVLQFLESGYGNPEYIRQIWETYPYADDYLKKMMSDRAFGHAIWLAIRGQIAEQEGE